MKINVDNIFTYHTPKDDQPKRYEVIRYKAKELARLFDTVCPDSAEKTLAIRKLQEAVMYANASIAINE